MSKVTQDYRVWQPAKVRLMHAITRHSLRNQLQGVYQMGPLAVSSNAVTAFVCNHSGRWDGFAIWQKRYMARSAGKHLSIVLEDSFNRYWVFRGAGAIPVSHGSAMSIRHMIRILRETLQPGDSVALFPQGHIFPGDKMPLAFKGLVRVLAHVEGQVDLVPTALATEMLHLKRPALFMAYGPTVSFASMSDPQRESEALVTAQVIRLRARLNELGENAITGFDHA